MLPPASLLSVADGLVSRASEVKPAAGSRTSVFEALFCVKSCHDHVDDVGDQDDRDGQVGDGTVGALDQGQQAELGDAEIRQAAYQGDHDGLQDRFSLISERFFFVCLDRVSNTPDHGGDHVDSGRHCPQDDQYGNERSQNTGAHTLLHHEQCGDGLFRHFRLGVDGQQAKDYDQHEGGVDHPADQHAFFGVARFLENLAVLDEDCDVAQLEGTVQESGIESLSKGDRRSLHGCAGCADPIGVHNDIRDIDGNQAYDDND